MRIFVSALALLGLVAFAGCQGNDTNIDTSPDLGDTPSGGAVPGQDAY